MCELSPLTKDRFKDTMKSSPKILRKISINSKQRPFRVVILGQNGVGKSALTVRFLTRRFIGEYDPYLEKVYTCNKFLAGENVNIEVLDTAVQDENNKMEDNIKWADAYILMYSVTDTMSFSECSRLKFLINAFCSKKRKSSYDIPALWTPCMLVGNQNDRAHDRMVSEAEGRSRASELGCVGFYEISVRESLDFVLDIFQDLFIAYRKIKKFKPSLYKQQSLPVPQNGVNADLSDSGESSDQERHSRSLNRRRVAYYTIS